LDTALRALNITSTAFNEINGIPRNCPHCSRAHDFRKTRGR
jgi:hypothetical protein